MSDTPRADAAFKAWNYRLLLQECKMLERELAEANKRIAALERKLESMALMKRAK